MCRNVISNGGGRTRHIGIVVIRGGDVRSGDLPFYGTAVTDYNNDYSDNYNDDCKVSSYL